MFCCTLVLSFYPFLRGNSPSPFTGVTGVQSRGFRSLVPKRGYSLTVIGFLVLTSPVLSGPQGGYVWLRMFQVSRMPTDVFLPFDVPLNVPFLPTSFPPFGSPRLPFTPCFVSPFTFLLSPLPLGPVSRDP